MKHLDGLMRIRTVIIVLAVCLIAGVACKHPKSSLKDTYKDMFLVGTALNQEQIFGKDTNALRLVKGQFNSITAENDMKWEKIHPQPGVYDFAASDSFVNFGQRNGMFVVGHCLLWHQQTPDWVFQDAEGKPISRDTLLKRLHDHIFTVVGRYKGRVHGWDVVNEAISDTGGLRKTKWLEIIGQDYIDMAFKYAHEADPSAELYYNDYSLPTPVKRDAVVKLIRELESRGVKVDGIGMQGHYTLDYPTAGAFDSSIVAFTDLGVNVMITEFDITVLPFPTQHPSADISLNVEFQKKYDPYANGLTDSMQTALAKRYYDLFKVLVKNANGVTRVTFWGVNDGQSWKNGWPIKGRKDYPLLFDRNNQPKPAFDAVIKCAGDKVKDEE